MELAQIWTWVGVGVAVVGVVLLWLRKPPATAADALAEVQEMVEFARQTVMAAEQLWQSGRLPRDGRFDWATAQLMARFPNLDQAQLTATIEAAVFWLKTGLAAQK